MTTKRVFDVKEYRADVIGFALEDRDARDRPEGIVTFRVFDDEETFEATARLRGEDCAAALDCMIARDSLCVFRAQRLRINDKDVFGYMTPIDLVLTRDKATKRGERKLPICGGD